MLIEIPRYTERMGSVRIHGVQKVLELDSGRDEAPTRESAVRKITRSEIEDIEKRMAIIVPVKDEPLKLFEGVLSGIPHSCLIIVVSNSEREPIDRYKMERDTLENFCTFTKHSALIIHQKDKKIAAALKKVGYTDVLDETGVVKNGKAEGMILGILMAKLTGKEYVGFIDADNYVPGAVLEYIKNYAAGFIMAKTSYVMVRNSWIYKPKMIGSDIYFRKWGRISEITNKHVNSMISSKTKFETEVIKTANSGEHAISIKLADIIPFASGFAVEPHELIFILEEFGGIKETPHKNVIDEGVEIFQVETRNPHFHIEKGNEHIADLLSKSLFTLFNSAMCDDVTKQEIKNDIVRHRILPAKKLPPKTQTYKPIGKIDLTSLNESMAKILSEESKDVRLYEFA